jgi:hypothetical protein
MRKIPCLFVRVFHGRDHATLTEEVTTGCEWVLAGEGTASRKWDGAACMLRDGVLHKRLDCKRGKPPPLDAIPCQEPDPVTGHWPHWVKVNFEASVDRWFTEAHDDLQDTRLDDGTYELIGPKVNGNPERVDRHVFRRHGDISLDVPRTYNGIAHFLASFLIEGVVFAHPDGRMCKIRRDDFGLAWPVMEAT